MRFCGSSLFFPGLLREAAATPGWSPELHFPVNPFPPSDAQGKKG